MPFFVCLTADGDLTTPGYPLQACQADCDDDSECDEGLICYQRQDIEAVPGCDGDPEAFPFEDFCIDLGNVALPMLEKVSIRTLSTNGSSVITSRQRFLTRQLLLYYSSRGP